MSMSILSFAGVALIALLLVNSAFGHSYLTNPITRSNQKQTNTGCRGPACLGPCDISRSATSRAPITIQRGATINPQWPRNNHAGGFIRFAWAQTSQSDSHSSFDNGVQSIYCHEIGGCKPDDPSNPNGGDSAPADGSRQPCQVSITVPLHLTDGLWTLQWAWFGGAFELGDYYSCVDYQISGGPTGSQLAPVFRGGDYSNPGKNVCKFFNTDRLHQCVNEPCNNPVYARATQQSGPAYGITASVTSTSSSSSTTTSTSSRSTSTSTSGRSTTGKATTGKGTTGKITTGAVKGTTGTKPTSTGSNSGMCYLPGTPNVNGTILSNPPYCGKNARKARCADGQCCSRYGYCGPIPDSNGNYYEEVNGVYQQVSYQVAVNLYCNRNQGDYRKVPCSELHNNNDASATDSGVSIKFDFFLIIASVVFIAIWNQF